MLRRGFLLGIGSCALIPALVCARAGLDGVPFLLERTLVRGLADGKKLTVIRRWAIRFDRPFAAGCEITGHQVYANVEAPSALLALAKMEEEREELGLFPIRLDNQRRIIGDPGEPALPPLPEDAIEHALNYAKSRAAKSGDLAVLTRFLADLSSHGHEWMTRLPTDLFFPVTRDYSARREIALPDGSEGVVEMHETAIAEAASGLLESFHREVVTRTAQVARRGSDTWRLSKAVS